MFTFALFIIPEISVYDKINESNHIDIVSFKSENKVYLLLFFWKVLFVLFQELVNLTKCKEGSSVFQAGGKIGHPKERAKQTHHIF